MNISTSLRMTALVAISGLAFVRCGGDQRTAEAPTMPSAEPPTDQSPELDAGTAEGSPATEPAKSEPKAAKPEPKPEALSDAQIAAITESANSAEIAQAKVAQVKSKDAGVKSFAAMMITHHGQAKQKQAKLNIKPEESGVSTAMHADAGATLNALEAATGKDFDRVYIASQVTGHQKVLDTINDKLLPNVKEPNLKAYLDEIKPKVEQHLQQAKQLQQSFDSKTPSTAAGSKSSG